MAEGKEGFLCYKNWLHTIQKLPDDKAGMLFKHLLMYVNDLNPVTDDLIVEVTFEPIKQTLKRDLISWEKTREKYSKAGQASAEARKKYKAELDEKHGTKTPVEKQSKPKKAIDPELEFDWTALLKYINTKYNRGYKVINESVRKSFRARIKEGYSKADIVNCIDNLVNATYHKENGYQYVTPEFISRPDTMAKYSTKSATPTSSPKPSNVKEL